MEAVTNQEVDVCLPFKELKELVRISRSDELELTGSPIEFPEFEKPTRYSLLNAFTETIKKYTPLRIDQSYMALNRCFGLDGHHPELW